ncbi:MAG TPA: hypothetical protein VIV55_09850 [Flavobacterium sp.]
MYQVVKRGTEYDLFSNEVINIFQSTIKNEITNLLSTTKSPKKAILGAFALHDVPMKSGGKTNVWIEYNAFILPIGVDAGIHQCIIYDEIPDVVLDKYNNIKTIIFNTAQNENTKL